MSRLEAQKRLTQLLERTRAEARRCLTVKGNKLRKADLRYTAKNLELDAQALEVALDVLGRD